MTKKSDIKRVEIVHKSARKSEKGSDKSKNIEKTLVENLIALQKIHTALAEKFDSLSKQISNLLVLFEMSARSFAQSPGVQSTEKDKEFLEKIDRLLEQNKTIAKGLTLMEERIRERVYGAPRYQETSEAENYQESQYPEKRPLPKF